jgi:hypothetical protein
MRLGDLVYYFTKYTGIRLIVKKITKFYGVKDCGCDKRREEWNEIKIDRFDKWIN